MDLDILFTDWINPKTRPTSALSVQKSYAKSKATWNPLWQKVLSVKVAQVREKFTFG